MPVARTALPTFDGPHPQYNSIVAKAPATVLGQVRSLSISDSIETTRAGRVGASAKKTLMKTKSPTYEMAIWNVSDLAELAAALNASSTPAAGSTVKLDPNATASLFYVHTYNNEAGTTHLNTIYMHNAVPTELGVSYDEDGEVVATISGNLEDVYWMLNSTGA